MSGAVVRVEIDLQARISEDAGGPGPMILRGVRVGPEAASCLTRFTLPAHEYLAMPYVRRVRGHFSVAGGDKLGVQERVFGIHVSEQAAVTITTLDVEDELNILPGRQSSVGGFGRLAVTLACRVLDLWGADSDVADDLSAISDLHLDGFAVDRSGDLGTRPRKPLPAAPMRTASRTAGAAPPWSQCHYWRQRLP